MAANSKSRWYCKPTNTTEKIPTAEVVADTCHTCAGSSTKDTQVPSGDGEVVRINTWIDIKLRHKVLKLFSDFKFQRSRDQAAAKITRCFIMPNITQTSLDACNKEHVTLNDFFVDSNVELRSKSVKDGPGHVTSAQACSEDDIFGAQHSDCYHDCTNEITSRRARALPPGSDIVNHDSRISPARAKNQTIVHRPHPHARSISRSVHHEIAAERNSHLGTFGSKGFPFSTKHRYTESVLSRIHLTDHMPRKCPMDSTPTLRNNVPTHRPDFASILEEPSSIHTKRPTFVTVELAVNAKIFLETYFNALHLGHPSARSLRRKRLESYLEVHSISEQQRQIERWLWAKHESNHLRLSRVLKGRSTESRHSRVEVAGYKAIKTIGKGSFGIVRLVKQQVTTGPACRNDSSLPLHTKDCEHSHNDSTIQSEYDDALRIAADGRARPAESKALAYNGQEQMTSRVYAMKVIRKSIMLQNCQEGHLRAERDFLVASEQSRWVVALLASFQDHTNLYLVMEFMAGGDFLGLLFRRDKLLEKHARWYLAEMVLCVEETHRLRWIHRDIKPDNFLISPTGHLKISDFGLAFDGHWAHDQRYFRNHRSSLMDALGINIRGDVQDQEIIEEHRKPFKVTNVCMRRKSGASNVTQADGPGEDEPILQWRDRRCKRRRAASMVGTSQYMAPEVIRGGPYDGRCDWWSIGIILFECLYGFTPFVCEDRQKTKEKILQNATSMRFPDAHTAGRTEDVSLAAMELIDSLLQEKEYRLSSRKYMINDCQPARPRFREAPGEKAGVFNVDQNSDFVYPGDAEDIKNHPFFDHINWDRLHLTRPPFVPNIKSKDDTKYFDDEEDDGHSCTSECNSHDEYLTLEQESQCPCRIAPHVSQRDGASARAMMQKSATGAEKISTVAPSNAWTYIAKTAKIRPRDRILRDVDMGRTALELRKRGAFLGYTYRRPFESF